MNYKNLRIRISKIENIFTTAMYDSLQKYTMEALMVLENREDRNEYNALLRAAFHREHFAPPKGWYPTDRTEKVLKKLSTPALERLALPRISAVYLYEHFKPFIDSYNATKTDNNRHKLNGYS